MGSELTLTFEQDSIRRKQKHDETMDNRRHDLLVSGQRWAGSLASIGVVGSVTSLLVGQGGVAATVMSAEFVGLIALFLYYKKTPEA